MRSHPRAALVLAAAMLCLAGPHADEPDIAPFTLAIVRQDGILTPFATWTGKAFANTWPVPEKEVDTPITLDEVPRRWWGKPGPPTTWHVWQAGGSTTDVRMTTPAWFPAHCQQGIGLRTSLTVRQPIPPPRVQPYPKIGIAATRRMEFQPIEALDPTAPIAAALLRGLGPIVNKDEDAAVMRYFREGWMHPYPDTERHPQPIKVEALYRAPAGPKGVFTYYFEAVKRYPPVRDRLRSPEGRRATAAPDKDACELVTFVYGWFVSRGDDETSIVPRLWETRLTSCDYEAVDVMLPIAYVMMKGRPVWITQFSGWGRERYALLDSESTNENEMILWAAHGGLCATGRGD
jgi:hypothetical protein